jgi:hypothetical protein
MHETDFFEQVRVVSLIGDRKNSHGIGSNKWWIFQYISTTKHIINKNRKPRVKEQKVDFGNRITVK